MFLLLLLVGFCFFLINKLAIDEFALFVLLTIQVIQIHSCIPDKYLTRRKKYYKYIQVPDFQEIKAVQQWIEIFLQQQIDNYAWLIQTNAKNKFLNLIFCIGLHLFFFGWILIESHRKYIALYNFWSYSPALRLFNFSIQTETNAIKMEKHC